MRIGVKVMPHSPKEEMTKQGDVYIVRIREAPVEGKANEAVIRLVAERFRVPKSAVKIVSGLTSRNKIMEIRTG
jgi:uncharacterized protein (TIGR00251 family)